MKLLSNIHRIFAAKLAVYWKKSAPCFGPDRALSAPCPKPRPHSEVLLTRPLLGDPRSPYPPGLTTIYSQPNPPNDKKPLNHHQKKCWCLML